MGTAKKKIWEKRTQVKEEHLKHDPSLLLRECYAYFNWVDENPYLKETNMVVDKAVKLTTTKQQRPYTMMGLCLYLNVDESFFRWVKSDKHTSDVMKRAINHIEKIVYENKFSGAAAGLFNANIISRDLGLVDKVNATNTNFNSVAMSKDEIKNINKELEDEY